jgi:hypothetical protein
MDDADSSKSQRVIGRPFKPGESGNPGGKDPEVEAVRVACRNYIASRCQSKLEKIEYLAEHGESEKIQLAASMWWAEQAIGKAVIAVSGEDGKPLQVTFGAELLSVLGNLKK